MALNLLTWLLLLPIIGAVLILFIPSRFNQWIRSLALIASGATVLVALEVVRRFYFYIEGNQMLEKLSWQQGLESFQALGMDGFSLPMVLLAVGLCFVALLASKSIRERSKEYYIAMLFLESAMLGVFLAQDWSFFYICWELTLIPLFVLINQWGGEKRLQAALNFILYTMGGSVFMLIAMLIAFDKAGGHTFAMHEMTANLRSLPTGTQILIFLGFFIGLGVKMPVFPLHGWLSLAHVQAPTPVSILLSGILLKMGAYGLIRVAAMLPQALVALQGILAILGFISLIYGGLLAWRQSDLKAMIAYSSVSHMGVVLLGIATLNHAGLTGAVIQMVAHGVVAGSLFLLIGTLYQHTHTREVSHYGGLIRVTPRFAVLTSLAFMGSVGIPGTAGFIAELHTIIGAFQRWGWIALLLSAGMMISAVYAVRTISSLFTGSLRDGMATVPDLWHDDLLAAGVLAIAIIALGILPYPLLQLIEPSINHFQSLFTGYL
jgi:NADH-quinone oxidoreductase subunit M